MPKAITAKEYDAQGGTNNFGEQAQMQISLGMDYEDDRDGWDITREVFQKHGADVVAIYVSGNMGAQTLNVELLLSDDRARIEWNTMMEERERAQTRKKRSRARR